VFLLLELPEEALAAIKDVLPAVSKLSFAIVQTLVAKEEDNKVPKT
jgi:hypothetical protein